MIRFRIRRRINAEIRNAKVIRLHSDNGIVCFVQLLDTLSLECNVNRYGAGLEHTLRSARLCLNIGAHANCRYGALLC